MDGNSLLGIEIGVLREKDVIMSKIALNRFIY